MLLLLLLASCIATFATNPARLVAAADGGASALSPATNEAAGRWIGTAAAGPSIIGKHRAARSQPAAAALVLHGASPIWVEPPYKVAAGRDDHDDERRVDGAGKLNERKQQDETSGRTTIGVVSLAATATAAAATSTGFANKSAGLFDRRAAVIKKLNCSSGHYGVKNGPPSSRRSAQVLVATRAAAKSDPSFGAQLPGATRAPPRGARAATTARPTTQTGRAEMVDKIGRAPSTGPVGSNAATQTSTLRSPGQVGGGARLGGPNKLEPNEPAHIELADKNKKARNHASDAPRAAGAAGAPGRGLGLRPGKLTGPLDGDQDVRSDHVRARAAVASARQRRRRRRQSSQFQPPPPTKRAHDNESGLGRDDSRAKENGNNADLARRRPSRQSAELAGESLKSAGPTSRWPLGEPAASRRRPKRATDSGHARQHRLAGAQRRRHRSANAPPAAIERRQIGRTGRSSAARRKFSAEQLTAGPANAPRHAHAGQKQPHRSPGLECPLDWCQCVWKNGKQFADCSGHAERLQRLPAGLDPLIQVLNTSGNQLVELRDSAFNSLNLNNLQRVYLSG